MNWHDITRNWLQSLDRLQTRFPNIDGAALAAQRPDMAWVIRHIAERHDLTQFEADQELDDWLFAESLAQQIDRLAG